MATRRRHPIHALPFDDGDVANALEAEYLERTPAQRFQARRKALSRDVMLAFNGQARRHVQAVPASTRRLLWVYTWTTVGDAIMDLAPRRLIPSRIDVDLLIAPALAPLFATDRRLRAVIDSAAKCGTDYDFILLDSLRTGSLRMKKERFAAVPFATMRGHQAGERFDRAAYADRRLRQLLALPSGPVEAPRLDLGSDAPTSHERSHFRVALALGARLQRKLYPHWPEVLKAIAAAWPAGRPRPELVLIGQGASAKTQRDEIERATAGVAVTSLIGSGSLRKTAIDIAACDAFLGVDGGLMHVAIGVGTPGLALFTRIDPAYFLRPDSTMAALHTDDELDAIAPAEVAAAFVAALPRFSAGALSTAAATRAASMALTSRMSERRATPSKSSGSLHAGSTAASKRATTGVGVASDRCMSPPSAQATTLASWERAPGAVQVGGGDEIEDIVHRWLASPA